MSILGGLMGDDNDEADKLLTHYMELQMAQKGEEFALDHLGGHHDQDLARQDRALDIELKRKALGLPLDVDLLDEDIEPDEYSGAKRGAVFGLGKAFNSSLGMSRPYSSAFSGGKTGLIPHLKTAEHADGLASSIGRIFRR